MRIESPVTPPRALAANSGGNAARSTTSSAPTAGGFHSANGGLSIAQSRQIAQLQATDRAVRAHELAHLAAGRDLVTSGPSFSYVTGPDGKRYATAGEVGIDTAPERSAAANLSKGERIVAAALAPADPSAQDYRVAAVGRRLSSEGAAQVAREQAAGTSRERSATDPYAKAARPDRVGQSVDLYA